MNRVPEYSWEGNPQQLGSLEDSPGLNIQQYLDVLLKFKWGILSVALLAALLGIYSAYKAIPIYQSRATLQIARDSGPVFGDMIQVQLFQFEFYKTQYELIRSWSVAEMTAERMGLLDADHLEGIKTNQKSQGFNWRNLVPEFLRIPEQEITPEIRRANIIAGIQSSILVSPVEQSELTHVSIESSDPAYAAKLANTVAESYIDFLRDKNLSDITGSQSWYASRLVKAREDLENAEQALQDFLDRQGMIQTSGGVDELQSQALQLAMTNREQARQDKLALERLHREIKAVDSENGLETITALESRGIVRQLKNDRAGARRKATQLADRYGPRHPRMIEAQALVVSAEQAYKDELKATAAAVVADYQRAVQTEASYSSQLSSAQTDIQALNRNRAELTKLQDDVQTSRALFEQLQSGEKTAGLLEGGQQDINVIIIEQARPGLYPVRPNKQRMVMTWMLAGIFVGIGLAFLLNMLDNTFKGPEDVERRLGLPVLGQLPQLKIDKGDQLAPMSSVIDQPRSVFSEAIRTIRTGVMLSMLDKERTVLAITSSVPGEGKTTLAINLAHAIAQMKKTLLIDADMRRPMVHKAKDIDQPSPGLAALMTGEVSFNDAVEVMDDGLHVILSGTVPPNPLELLSSQKFKDLVRELQKTYEVIIIDSAPALAVSDALVVAQLADAQLYVIRADSTPFQAAEQGIKRLRRVNAPLLGCILNQVPSSKAYGYGKTGKYGRLYRYGYGAGRYGYHSQDHYHDYYADEAKESKT